MRVFSLCLTLAGLTFSGALIAGCSPPTVMVQAPNTAARMGSAPETGQYLLYTGSSLSSLWATHLREGDPLGFRRSDDGRWIAIAGSRSFILPTGTTQMYWKLVQQ